MDLVWLGAGILAVFTLLCIPIAHPFWKLTGEEKSKDFQIVLEHIALVGGLILAAVATLN